MRDAILLAGGVVSPVMFNATLYRPSGWAGGAMFWLSMWVLFWVGIVCQ